MASAIVILHQLSWQYVVEVSTMEVLPHEISQGSTVRGNEFRSSVYLPASGFCYRLRERGIKLAAVRIDRTKSSEIMPPAYCHSIGRDSAHGPVLGMTARLSNASAVVA